MRVDGSSPSNRTRVPVFLGCYSAGTFYLILVIPGSFNTMLRSISYRKQQGFVSRAQPIDHIYDLLSWELYVTVVQLVERRISNPNVCEFKPRQSLHAARQDSFAH